MNKNELLRRLPKTDDVLKEGSLVVLAESSGSLLVTEAVREVLGSLRERILSLKEDETDSFNTDTLSLQNVAALAAEKLAENEEMRLYPVVNATGTILHTNLGRAPLCADAVRNVEKVSRGYSDLEYNVELGRRGSRHDLVCELIAELTGAEDAMVVNNNAAATMIVLAALGKGKEIVVSRSELVEIGGAFRIPDIMSQSGAFLQEVGTSNKVRITDYENAIMTAEAVREYDPAADPRRMLRFETGALMKVHRSNYDVVGFTEEVSLEELTELGTRYGLPVIFDMGNGLMLDMKDYGLNEPNVPESLASGIDVILFSGDKLLGGPQAGIICGRRRYIKQMKKHPLARAMRVDKMTFAALEATLAKYRDPKLALRDIPVLSMIAASEEDLRRRAEKLAGLIKSEVPSLSAEAVPVEDQIGGGSAPMVRLPGWAVSVTDPARSAQSLERRIRRGEPPVIARINEDRLLLCVRTVADDEFAAVAEALK